MCECVCYCAYFYYVNKLYVHVCVLERAKHSFFALPNPLSCSVMNKICLNQTFMLGHGGSSAGSYLADPTSPIPSHCAVIILFQSVTVHQLS